MTGAEGFRLSDYDYYLPKELIAQDPLAKRSDSRLLVLYKDTGRIFHDHFYNIDKYLASSDMLVINNTKVIPARLLGIKETGAKIEFLLLKRLGENEWETLVKPGKRCGVGTKVIFGDGILTARVTDILDGGSRVVSFEYEGIFEEILDKLGQMPLPPYITHALSEKERYQTVYAKYQGSAAAPTAGLHFTKELMEKLKARGNNIEEITLHVGLGTFRPVDTENILDHKMHSEYYNVDANTAANINSAVESGKKVIAVGTTSVRTLETIGSNTGKIEAGSGETDIFIYPGYDFKIVKGIVTNFHLPKSTLLMLVSAFAGRETVLNAYEEAVKEKYRFFSFGDAMLIL